MKVICISGKARSGKDTSAGFIERSLKERGKKVLVMHYADLLKFICKSYFEWDGVKDENGRRILQFVGTDVIREQNPDYWVLFVHNFLYMFEGIWDYVLIPDARFPNEIDIIKQGFDTLHLRVARSNFTSPLTEEQQKHISETALDHYIPDACIMNDGTLADLETKINIWLEEAIYGTE